MRNVRALFSYDGSRFFGWQRQDGFPTVQEAVESALHSLLGEPHTVYGSGRTDTGVHALGQVANFHVETQLDDERLLFALNAHLDEGVVVRALETCPDDFHAQKHAIGKRYAYVLLTTRFRPPFAQDFAHWTPDSLDLGAMRRAALDLSGEHDFSAFATSGSPRKSNVRRIASLHWIARRDRLAFVIQGNGFLYNMVRTIAGTLLEVGRGKRARDSIADLIASRDRTQAGPTAAASGLYLVSVLYAEPSFRGHATTRRPPGVFPLS